MRRAIVKGETNVRCLIQRPPDNGLIKSVLQDRL